MTELSIASKTAQKQNLSDIISNAGGIAMLARRMKRDNSYITPNYLQALVDDADSIKNLVNQIANRNDYKEIE